ncbi:hypothetical protein QBC38DRAFT_37375 [Podospora fimiseda]|uniref:Transmembrane protein n=1 Tax=Podospora fimiseda TaxID=252190 RepID=A0AAN7BIJ2_9PEZI|nr:hypothetical protein QBC38DRAFT_37375 [Podospora fimiseda]
MMDNNDKRKLLLQIITLFALTLTTLTSFYSSINKSWITLVIPSDPEPLIDSVGLYQRCVYPANRCVLFPEQERQCSSGGGGGDDVFCRLWWIAGMILGCVVPVLQVLISLGVVYYGGGWSLRKGWV